MIAARHILGTFDESLAALRNNVLMMAGLTERSLERAMKGLVNRDDNICAHAIADDEEIDQLEKQIDKDGVDILLRFQPVASDLRRVVAAMKLSSNLERMADQATTIARRARKLNQHPLLPEVELIRPMYDHAMSMFKDSVDAFTREDVELGRAVVPRDQGLDDLNPPGQPQASRAHGAGSGSIAWLLESNFYWPLSGTCWRSRYQHCRGRCLRGRC